MAKLATSYARNRPHESSSGKTERVVYDGLRPTNGSWSDGQTGYCAIRDAQNVPPLATRSD